MLLVVVGFLDVFISLVWTFGCYVLTVNNKFLFLTRMCLLLLVYWLIFWDVLRAVCFCLRICCFDWFAFADLFWWVVGCYLLLWFWACFWVFVRCWIVVVWVWFLFVCGLWLYDLFCFNTCALILLLYCGFYTLLWVLLLHVVWFVLGLLSMCGIFIV